MDTLSINKANCIDCHKCIRSCHFNAIKFINGHAQIDYNKCVLDGNCYHICPQNAKFVQNDIQRVKELLNTNVYKVASIAPSFFAYYSEYERSQILAKLKRAGFDHVEQTSRAAYTVALAHLNHYQNNGDMLITSSCPSAVLLIEKHYPELLKYLAPVDSPMVAHYKILNKEIDQPFEMVFISPCIAKKQEVKDTKIYASLTFEELEEWLFDENPDTEALEPVFFEPFYSGNLSLFPLLGALVETAGLTENRLKADVISVEGIKNIDTLLNDIKYNRLKSSFIEVLACEGGCLAGPARPGAVRNLSSYQLKENLLDSYANINPTTEHVILSDEEIRRTYFDRKVFQNEPSENEINKVLHSIDKYVMEDELNCGACGYDTCRDKAKAVIRGDAEKEMCMPYMKARFERLFSALMRANPNGVIILNNEFTIIGVNKAFLDIVSLEKQDLFEKNITVLIDKFNKEELIVEKGIIKESIIAINGIKYKKIAYSIEEHSITICFLIDISDIEEQKKALNKVKRETIERAQQVVDKQMTVAQEIASLLGETTAETKIRLGQLIKCLEEDCNECI